MVIANAKAEECPICFSEEAIIDKYCHGCEHEFCFKCISSWVTDHNARCPLCNGNIYGIYSQDSSIYLTPHHLSTYPYGIHIKKHGDGTVINKVIKDGVAEQLNMNIGNLIMINNKFSYSDCLTEIAIAHLKKKMIKIDIISTDHAWPTKKSNNCLNFLRRVCQISPNSF